MIDALIQQCAIPNAPAAIIREIIRNESADDPIAVNINGINTAGVKIADTADQAAAVVEIYLEAGKTVDVGYMQVNTIHLASSGLTVRELFDPCINITIGSQIFTKAYIAAKGFYGDTPLAVESALSAYNTGTFHKGFENGYVDRYAGTDADNRTSAVDAAQADSRIDLDFSSDGFDFPGYVEDDVLPDPEQ